MQRHHALPAVLLVIAACSIVAAVLLGASPTDVSSLPATTTTIMSTSTVTADVPPPPPPTPVVGAAEPTGIGAVLSSLDSVWAQTRNPSTSCLVVLMGARVVFERNPDLAVIPASTMKLLTATALLEDLPAGDRLRTRVLTSTEQHDGVIDGDLYLVGGGDPVLGTVDWAAHFERQPRMFTPIETLADRIVSSGVRQVHGRIVGDESRYDRERYVPSWPTRYRDDNETGPLSALFVNDGFAVWNGPDPQDVPWDDPPRDAAAVLTALLRARGVVVDGDPAAGVADSAAQEIAGIDSPPIGELVTAMLQDSDNGTAELLVKELGLRRKGAGSTAAGVAVVSDTLGREGLPMDHVSIHDGSGLDRGDHVTCRMLMSILMRADANGPIGRGLPIAAQTGTLYKRFLATPVAGHLRAKTGSITGVAALAGYADSTNGSVTFVHVLNGIGTYAAARRVQDALGAALVGL